jgi:hypothetical protein
MSEFTTDELETLQRRIDDPDWDISQCNDVWEMLPRLLEAVKLNDKTMCAYCGFVHEDKNNFAAIFDHVMNCEKRPERKLLDRAFEVEDRLYERIIHLTQDAYTPVSCKVCGEIEETLRIYQEKE